MGGPGLADYLRLGAEGAEHDAPGVALRRLLLALANGGVALGSRRGYGKLHAVRHKPVLDLNLPGCAFLVPNVLFQRAESYFGIRFTPVGPTFYSKACRPSKSLPTRPATALKTGLNCAQKGSEVVSYNQPNRTQPAAFDEEQ